MAKVNPTTIFWANPTSRTDGTPYGQADNAGYELAITGAATPPPATGQIAIPLAFGTSFDVSTLAAYQGLSTGDYDFYLRVVDKNGLVSGWSNAAPFSRAMAPMVPTNLTIS